jgi:hypothetical protein
VWGQRVSCVVVYHIVTIEVICLQWRYLGGLFCIVVIAMRKVFGLAQSMF